MTLFDELFRLPGSPQLHRWADWAELLCFTSASGSLSLPEFAFAIAGRSDYIPSEISDDIEPEEKLRKEDLVRGLVAAQITDKAMDKAVQVFEYLGARCQAYGETYPFALDDDGLGVELRETSLSRSVYLFLLACASLRYVAEKAVATQLTSRYELLCLEVVRRSLPNGAEVHLFGKNSADTTSRYVGKVTEKITQLADDLGEIPRFDEDDFEQNDSGDNGLDIVAWVSLGDQLNGRFVIFGQCACTPQWVTKQHSSSYDTWSSVMSLMVRPVNTCFIPFDFRKPSGKWYSRHQIHRSVLFDRRRILAQLGLLETTDSSESLDRDLLDALRLHEIEAARSQDLEDL
jgi:hypothetical protein